MKNEVVYFLDYTLLELTKVHSYRPKHKYKGNLVEYGPCEICDSH